MKQRTKLILGICLLISYTAAAFSIGRYYGTRECFLMIRDYAKATALQAPAESYGGTITEDGNGGYDFAGTFTGDEVKHFYELGHGRWPAGATSVTYEELNEAMENAHKEPKTLHTKKYEDGFQTLWCGETRIYICGGSANFSVNECSVCGMCVHTTGHSPETDIVYETDIEVYSKELEQ